MSALWSLVSGRAQINGREEIPDSGEGRRTMRISKEQLLSEEQSLTIDLKILLMTAKQIALREGVFH